MTTTSKQRADCGDPGQNKPAVAAGPRTSSPTSSSTRTNEQQTNAAPSNQANQGGGRCRSDSKQEQQRKVSSANLLSPNNAYESQSGGASAGREQQRRRSTLSANGFFIDYSCTRRRSCAASHQQQARANSSNDPLAKSQFLRSVISPVRRPSTMIAGSMSGAGGGGGGTRESFSVYSQRAQSRASCSFATTTGHLLQPPGSAGGGPHRLRAPSVGGCGMAARSMAGSRKTSIFDPTGHSLAAAARRRSTMTASGSGAGFVPSGASCSSPLSPAIEQATTMLAVSRQAAALQRAEHLGGKHELVERVPVIGCSPTSIRASLAALDETRRYKKLLHKLKKHQKRKEKERIRLIDDEDNELMCDIDLDDERDDSSGSSGELRDLDCDETGAGPGGRGGRHQRRPTTTSALGDEEEPDATAATTGLGSNLRRKSLRAIKDVGLLLNKAAVMQKRRRRRKRRWRMSSASTHRGDSFVDGLSISSTLSFVSSQTSSPSIDRFLNELSLFQYGNTDENDEQERENNDKENNLADDDDDDDDDDEEDDDEDGDYDYESRAELSEGETAAGAASCFSELDQVCYGDDDDGQEDDDDDGDGARPGSSRAPSSSAVNQRNDRAGPSGVGQRAGKNNNEQASSGLASQRNGNDGVQEDVGNDEHDGARGAADEERQRKQQQQQQARDSVMSRGRAKSATNNNNNNNNNTGSGGNARSSLVRKAMRRITATLGARRSPSSGNLATGLTQAGANERYGTSETAGREFGETKTRLNKQQLANEECRAAAAAAAQTRARRRSVSMSAGLNYWHYYYYLRNNSLDQQDGGPELPLMLASRASHSGNLGGGGGGLGGASSGRDQQAGMGGGPTAAGGAGSAGPGGAVGGCGTPMSDFDRRARLYINYSLARLEILNCQSDPVAQLAERLAKAEAKHSMLQQQADWGPGAQETPQPVDQGQSPVWDRLFDFSDSTDVSLTLSTSSSCIAPPDTSRDSSSLSSAATASSSSSSSSMASADDSSSSASSSSLELHNVEPAASSPRAPTKPVSLDDQHRQTRQQHLSAVANDGTRSSSRPDLRVSTRADNSQAGPALSASSHAGLASSINPGEPAGQEALHHQQHQQHYQLHHHHLQQQHQQQQPPSHSHSSQSIHSRPAPGQQEARLDYVCQQQQQQHSSCLMPQQQTAAHIPYANLIPGQDLNHHQQQARPTQNNLPTTATINDCANMAADSDSEQARASQLRSRSISRSVGCMGQQQQQQQQYQPNQPQQQQQQASHDGGRPTSSAAAGVFRQVGTSEAPRETQEGPALGARPFQRDAHFRFSVKAPSKQLADDSSQHHQEAAAAATSAHRDDHHYRHKQQQQQQQQQQRLQLGPVSRRSRASQSWDRLEIATDQHQLEPHSLASSASQSRSTVLAAKPATATPNRASTNDQLERTEEPRLTGSTTSGRGGDGSGVGGLRLGSADSRRSFRLPKATRGADRSGGSPPPTTTASTNEQQQPSASTSAKVATSAGAGWASRSKSFLFQGRLSFRSKHNKQTTAANDEPRALVKEHPQPGNEPRDNGDDYARRAGPTVAQGRRSSGRRAGHSPMEAPRDEQREAADKLLEQFEAQMSQAASLGREAELNSARSYQQQQHQRLQEASASRRDYHQHHESQSGPFFEQRQSGGGNHTSQQGQLSPCRLVAGLSSRSSASSTQSIDSSQSQRSHRRDRRHRRHHHHHRSSRRGSANQKQPPTGKERQPSDDASLAASVMLGGAGELMPEQQQQASRQGPSMEPTGGGGGGPSASPTATGHHKKKPMQASDCYCYQPQLQASLGHHDNQLQQQRQLSLSLSASQRFGGSQRAVHNQQLYRDSLSVADGPGRGQQQQQQPHLDSIESAPPTATSHYLGAQVDGQAMLAVASSAQGQTAQQRNWPQQQATQVRQYHHQAASHHHLQQQQQQQQQHDDNNNSNFSRNTTTTNESSFDSCMGSMRQQSSSSNEDATNHMRAYEFNHQQQAARNQMNSMPSGSSAGAVRELAPRARAHSTSASTDRGYAYGHSSHFQPHHQRQLEQHQQQRQQQQHISNQLQQQQQNHHHERLGIGGHPNQASASSMLTLNTLTYQQMTAREVRLACGLAESIPLHLQLTPRLLASDSAGYFLGQQQDRPALPERVCQSARPSTVHLVAGSASRLGELTNASGQEVGPSGTARRGEPAIHAANSCSPAHSPRAPRPPGDEPLAGGSSGRRCSGLGAAPGESATDRRQSLTANSGQQRRRSSARTNESRRPTSAREFTDGTTTNAGDDLSAQALSLLRKNSFACTILGARQTGKRTIVICFVKLLNEFKLAADEYKKEKMLTKLVECSEKLQELASRREQMEGEEEEEQRRRQQRRTSRLNSWLPTGETVKNLLNLSPVSKKRLHSVAGPLLTVATSRKQSDARRQSGAQAQLGSSSATLNRQGSQSGKRRHTTIEPPSFQLMGRGSNQGLSINKARGHESPKRAEATTTNELLSVNRGQQQQQQQRSNLFSVQHNKSDTNINYQATDGGGRNDESCATISASEPSRAPGGSSFQLQVPTWDSVSLRRQADCVTSDGGSGGRGVGRARAHSSTSVHPVIRNELNPEHDNHHEDDDDDDANIKDLSHKHPNGDGKLAGPAMSRQRRHTTNISSVGFFKDARGQADIDSTRAGPRCSLSPSTAAAISSRARPRRQSICMSRRRLRIMLSLKELNRRKFAIKFNTRRQISASLIGQMRQAEQMRAANSGRAGRRKSTIIQLSGGGAGSHFAPMPDAFLVVYSINDRDSFDYARSMIEQLRSMSELLQQDVPLPIMLIANKSDLERNREVKIDDGRAVAKKYSCKFIEISCTIGFNLDNLLVGLRTQLVLKHHVVLNSILRPDFRRQTTTKTTKDDNNKYGDTKDNNNKRSMTKGSSDNILIRFYKRYVMDNHEDEYDCDNFSKL